MSDQRKMELLHYGHEELVERLMTMENLNSEKIDMIERHYAKIVELEADNARLTELTRRRDLSEKPPIREDGRSGCSIVVVIEFTDGHFSTGCHVYLQGWFSDSDDCYVAVQEIVGWYPLPGSEVKHD